MTLTESDLVDAYVFGYPLVYNIGSIESIGAKGLGSLPPSDSNEFAFATKLAGPDDPFVSVNNDTLYAVGRLDLSGGPVLLHVPDTAGAYYVLQFVDASTNNFASVGKRATGTGEGSFLVVGPGFAGDAPNGETIIHSPTDIAVIVGRLSVAGEADLPHVLELEPQFTLTPLGGNSPPAEIPQPDPGVPDALKFWEMLRLWSQAFAPSAADQAYLDRFAEAGITDTGSPYVGASPELTTLLTGALVAGKKRVEELSTSTGEPPVNGWLLGAHMFDYNRDSFELGTVPTAEWIIAEPEAAYRQRAIAARIGLWGNNGYEAIYP
jgi:hypothetical protein